MPGVSIERLPSCPLPPPPAPPAERSTAQRLRLFCRRTIWWPTWLGWMTGLLLVGAPTAWWWFRAEPTLAATNRVPADVLVVEGWIGAEGVRVAAEEFFAQGYRYVIATGGLSGEQWSTRRWSHADVAESTLLAQGVPRASVILASSLDRQRHRTHESAVATVRALQEQGIRPRGVNVFTRTVHARRSRLVFARTLGNEVPVGSVSWSPPGYAEDPAWWRYSYRAEDLLKESVGFVIELLFRSGRSGPAIEDSP